MKGRRTSKLIITFLYAGVALQLQACRQFADDFVLYSEYNSRLKMQEALTQASTQQLNEYFSGMPTSSFSLNVECYDTYSITPAASSTIVVNIANQKRCDDISIWKHIHKISLVEDEIVEVLCQDTGYVPREIEDFASKVGWNQGRPVCPQNMHGDAVQPMYRRYSTNISFLERPEFRNWEGEVSTSE